MQLRSLLDRLDRIETLNLYEGLNKIDSRSMMLWESAGKAIKEAALTSDQIQTLFKNVEQGASAAGGNRTMIGQGKDVASAVNKAWEDLKTKVQDSGPVKNIDAMYDRAAEKLKAATGGEQGVMQYVQKYRDFAKAHPIAQSLIYSALIAAAGISGAGLGGAAALALFKMTDKLLQGEKFSSAAYSGAKTGGMAYAAGQIGQALKGQPQGEVPAGGAVSKADQMYNRLAAQHQAAADRAASVGGSGTISQATGISIPDTSALQGFATDPNLSPIAQKLASDLASGKNVAGAGEYLTKAMNSASQKASMMGDMPDGSANAGMRQFMSLQNLFRAADNANALKESVTLSESQIATLFTLIQINNRQFNEGMWDAIKNKAATVGTNLTTKVTADKLNSAWKKAGSPTDSDAVAQILQGAGVDPTVISKAYTDLNIPAPTGRVEPTLDQPAATAPVVNNKELLAQILKLTPAEQQQVLAHLKK